MMEKDGINRFKATERRKLADFAAVIRKISSRTKGGFAFTLDADGHVRLIKRGLCVMIWQSSSEFLFGDESVSVFAFVRDALNAQRQKVRAAAAAGFLADRFCLENAWIAALNGCRSIGELKLKLAVMSV